jgi:hypothetical protein
MIKTFQSYNELSKEDKVTFCNSKCENKTYDYLKMKMMNPKSPKGISGLYRNIMFPKFNNKDMSLNVDDDDIFSGCLVYKEGEITIEMNWYDYCSQLYDGELNLAVQSERSIIFGRINDEYFSFLGSTLYTGAWPGFLSIYK